MLLQHSILVLGSPKGLIKVNQLKAVKKYVRVARTYSFKIVRLFQVHNVTLGQNTKRPRAFNVDVICKSKNFLVVSQLACFHDGTIL
jgi:hypothetical protein